MAGRSILRPSGSLQALPSVLPRLCVSPAACANGGGERRPQGRLSAWRNQNGHSVARQHPNGWALDSAAFGLASGGPLCLHGSPSPRERKSHSPAFFVSTIYLSPPRQKAPPRAPARNPDAHAPTSVVRVPMGNAKPCSGTMTIPNIFTLKCNCEDSQPARHQRTVWHITEDGRDIMQYAKRYVRIRREKGFTDEQSLAAQRAVVICWGAWVASIWDIPKPVQPQSSCSSMLTWGLLTVRTGLLRTSLLRAARIGCTGQLAPGAMHCTYAVRVPALGKLYVPRAVAPQVAMPPRHPRGGGRPAGGTAGDPDPGVRGTPEDRVGARQRQRRAPSRGC